MFCNTPFVDFSIAENRSKFQACLDALNADISSGPLSSQPIINGSVLETKDHLQRNDPAQPSVLLGEIQCADLELLDFALTQLKGQQLRWRQSDPMLRVELLRATGQLLEENRGRLASIMVRESGKPWAEADADLAEAVDFCFYYADQMELLIPGESVDLPGQQNHTEVWPRGIVAVIAPWNFPLAILCGMTVAGLVTGNQVVIKPAEQSSIIAFEFAKILLKAGFPPESFAFLPGKGEVIGKALVESRYVDMICFTGSMEVGLMINEQASIRRPGQRSVKRIIAEMGGKNAIVVDSDADLDAAVSGILKSAFGYAGQKCSACSRVLVVANHYERVCQRLQEAAKDLIVGAPCQPETMVGPLIDAESKQRVLQKIAEFEKTIPVLYKGETPPEGHFVPVTIFKDVPKDSALWNEELFAPVLAIQKSNSFEEAILNAGESDFALTGAVFSRHPEHIEFARRNMEVGNLYINQGSTGALVGRQPFGGFKLSGCGAKAGGKHYLQQFVNERTITENTMRKGYTPELA